MVHIDDRLLQRLQELAMLQIPEEEKEQIEEELNRFLEFVEVLNELDLEGVEPSFLPVQNPAPLRPDEPQLDPTIPEMVLAHAPKVQDHFFIVPKIIE
ncbi:MAG: Asp-tRNA(Asn)/Glu-tRNA(Gln) amidotransferase GatCAB subunit C [Nitratiruptor sp.]|nr:Asp-tRNA(Asn)/Glu-tRNA(Gln) amidotransferase GatCAB subunit C [Nitratiruptor sp.]NPA83962.1 Asp-tRNA(Asn)/Glu-tRNA(Gln) amidotransferase subunit GatC [Campylobacterota bacterium]